MESFRTTEGRGRARRPVARLLALGMAAALAIVLVPGAAVASPNYPANLDHMTVVPAFVQTIAAGGSITYHVEGWDSSNNDLGDVTAWTTFSLIPAVTGTSCTGATCTSTVAGVFGVQATNGTVFHLWPNLLIVTPLAATHLGLSGLSSGYAGAWQNLTVTALDKYGNTDYNYTGTVHLTSTDAAANLPSDHAFTSCLGPCNNGVYTFHGVILNTIGSQTVTATDVNYNLITGSETVKVYPAPATYLPVVNGSGDPITVRVVDSRAGLGLAGKLAANVPSTFDVAGRMGIPAYCTPFAWSIPDCATAVVGNLTVANATAGWAIALSPLTTMPTTSTLNFVTGETVANGVTVALGAGGTLTATYLSTTGNTADLVFDVTGYYTPQDGGATYMPVTPTRILDTRTGVAWYNPTNNPGTLPANQSTYFRVTGTGNGWFGPTVVPDDATAVTGNVTVTNATAGWALAITPDDQGTPQTATTSTLNFSAGQTIANNVTVPLSDSSINGHYGLYMTFITGPGTQYSGNNNTVDVVFDVTGYYTGIGSSDQLMGASFVPIAPGRLLDTRYGTGLTGPFAANTARDYQVTGQFGLGAGTIPNGAAAVTGNVTVTDDTNGWALDVTPSDPVLLPTTSTVNFVAGEIASNGFTVGLGSGGALSTTYISTTGNTTDVVEDITGYFVNVGEPPSKADITAVNATVAKQLTITWNTPTVQGGSPIVGYVATATLNHSPWTTLECSTLAGNPNTCTITGLATGSSYWIHVRAYNGTNHSDASWGPAVAVI